MGAKSQRSAFPDNKYYSILDYGYCKVWKRNDNHKQTMEQYDVIIQNEEELIKYQKMWQLRTHQQQIVNVYYFAHQSNSQICSLSHKGNILTQRIPYRLSQFCNIPYEEALSILNIVLNSFKILYRQYGLFQVRSTMIGINYQKQIKVWHHTDFSTPQPQNHNCKSLSHMIDSIIISVQMNADIPDHYIRFSQFVSVNRNKIIANFDDIFFVLKAFKEMNQIKQFNGLPQFAYYLRQAEGWEQLSLNTHFLTNLSNIAQLNQFSPQRQIISSSRGSLNSSMQTIKNIPSMNIYTHKQVNQILERQRQKSQSRSQQRLREKQRERLKQRQSQISPITINNKQRYNNKFTPFDKKRYISPVPKNISTNIYNPFQCQPLSSDKQLGLSSSYRNNIQFKLVSSPISRLKNANQKNSPYILSNLHKINSNSQQINLDEISNKAYSNQFKPYINQNNIYSAEIKYYPNGSSQYKKETKQPSNSIQRIFQNQSLKYPQNSSIYTNNNQHPQFIYRTNRFNVLDRGNHSKSNSSKKSSINSIKYVSPFY